MTLIIINENISNQIIETISIGQITKKIKSRLIEIFPFSNQYYNDMRNEGEAGKKREEAAVI